QRDHDLQTIRPPIAAVATFGFRIVFHLAFEVGACQIVQQHLKYECCGDTHRGVRQVMEDLPKHGFRVDPAFAQSALDRFTALGLMLEDDGRYLSLALPEPTFTAVEPDSH